MALNMTSPIVRASLGMVVGALAVLVLGMIPGLQFLNVWYAIGAGALCAVGTVLLGRGRATGV